MALEPDAHIEVKVEDGDVLYDFLRRDRDEALLTVAELRHEKRLLEDQIETLRNAANVAEDHSACNAEIQQLRTRNSQVEGELEAQRANVRSATAAREHTAAELAAERRDSQMYQQALEEARDALETTSAWGHETNDSLQKANVDLHQQVLDLRRQRSLRNKVVSRYRWEMEVRDRISAEIHGSGTALD